MAMGTAKADKLQAFLNALEELHNEIDLERRAKIGNQSERDFIAELAGRIEAVFPVADCENCQRAHVIEFMVERDGLLFCKDKDCETEKN